MKNEQLELPIPRVRNRLDSTGAMASAYFGTPGTGAAVEAVFGAGRDDPYTATPGHPVTELIRRTPWETKEDPPCPGWWEVTDHETGTLRARWWFGGVWWIKGDPNPSRTSTPGAGRGETFRVKYAWRGLVEPSPEVYGAPYNSVLIMQRARDLGVSIKTPYMRITQSGEAVETTPRTRTRL